MELTLLIVFGFAIGASVASFLNVVADRLPEGGLLISPGSHCPVDGHELRAFELVPVFSYLFLRGKCRVCASRIPLRVPLVELMGGVMFALVAWQYGATLDTLLLVVVLSFLLVITVIDLEHQLVLNSVLLVALPSALVSSVLWSESLREPVWDIGPRVVNLLTDGVAAGLVAFAIILAIVVVTRGRGMGMGDVKLVLVIGVWVGLSRLPVALYAAVILGGVIAIFLVLIRRRGRKSLIPFAPFLCAGTAIGLFWGDLLGEWYLELLTP